MRFLFISAAFCLRRPSDSASRRTPLPSASTSPYRGGRGTLTRKYVRPVAETRAKETELAKQTELICELRALIRDYEKRDDDIKQLINANAELRAECRRLRRLPKS